LLQSNLNAQKSGNPTALHIALANNHSEVVKELINNGANVNAKAFEWPTILSFAIGKKEIFDLLIAREPTLTKKIIIRYGLFILLSILVKLNL